MNACWRATAVTGTRGTHTTNPVHLYFSLCMITPSLCCSQHSVPYSGMPHLQHVHCILPDLLVAVYHLVQHQ